MLFTCNGNAFETTNSTTCSNTFTSPQFLGTILVVTFRKVDLMSFDIDIDFSLLLILVIFGFLAAFIDSVVGGGGLISLPALLFVGLSPSAAVATNKLAGTMGSLTSTITFYRSGKMDFKSVSKFFPLVFIGSALGAWIVHLMDPNVLKPLMLIMLAGVAVYTVFKKDWGSISTYKKLSPSKFALFIVVIFAIGFYIAALLMFMFLGQIHYAYGIPMGIAQIFGAIIGSKFALKQGTGYVRVLFIIVTCSLLVKNIYDYFYT